MDRVTIPLSTTGDTFELQGPDEDSDMELWIRERGRGHLPFIYHLTKEECAQLVVFLVEMYGWPTTIVEDK